MGRRLGDFMELVIDKLRDAARRLRGLRAGLCLSVVAGIGYLLGTALKDGAAVELMDALLFAWVLAIGGAAFVMKTAEARAAQRQQAKLDALYGRRAG